MKTAPVIILATTAAALLAPQSADAHGFLSQSKA
ncbi:hypothetical protein Gpo141_00011176, partial [Globisporangium polare]